ncbi:MAG: Smr/MutS family protein [Caulobacteraceae bacterium]|nr:Smr/MutS family protein [Caulobacteraceae bacterium]MBK8543017.1 Smr/MutS family protein [Caulobacteraceae bacterium]
MSKKKRELTVDEKKLWRRVAASVKTRRPVPAEPEDADEAPAPKRAMHVAPKPAPAPVRAKATPAPQDRGNEKRVRRGKLEIGGKLDLHGHTQDTGRAALARFLRSAQARGDRTVIVITGVGRGGEGTLKRRFPEWIAERDIRVFVSGYAPAHRAHGGAGAFYVFIRRGD